MYIALKHAHLTFVIISILLFVYRFVASKLMAKTLPKVLKVLPHVVDTLLLASAIGLCVVLQQYPFVHGWLTLKIAFVIGYIVTALMAMKSDQKNTSIAFAVAAIVCVVLAAKIAVIKPVF